MKLKTHPRPPLPFPAIFTAQPVILPLPAHGYSRDKCNVNIGTFNFPVKSTTPKKQKNSMTDGFGERLPPGKPSLTPTFRGEHLSKWV
jgi:hypothetical protein